MADEESKIAQQQENGESPETEQSRQPEPETNPAGFWVRALCFVLDIIILHMFFNALTFFFRESFFQYAEYTEYFGAAVVFCYFWLGNGHVGKGRTLGKFLFSLHVQNYEGGVLDPLSALKRTFVQAISPHYMLLVFSVFFTERTQTNALIQMFLFSLSLAFMTSNGLLVAFHPLKQGIHDYLSGSIVAKGPGNLDYQRLYADVSAGLLGKKQRTPSHAIKVAGSVFLVIGAFQIYSGYQQITSKDAEVRREIFEDLEENYSIQNFELYGFRMSRIPEEGGEQDSGKDEPAGETQTKELTTTGTANGEPATGRYRLIVIYISERDVKEDEVKDNPEVLRTLNRLREYMRRRLPEISRRTPEEESRMNAPEEIRVEFVEAFSLFAYTHHKSEAQITLPFDDQNNRE